MVTRNQITRFYKIINFLFILLVFVHILENDKLFAIFMIGNFALLHLCYYTLLRSGLIIVTKKTEEDLTSTYISYLEDHGYYVSSMEQQMIDWRGYD